VKLLIQGAAAGSSVSFVHISNLARNSPQQQIRETHESTLWILWRRVSPEVY